MNLSKLIIVFIGAIFFGFGLAVGSMTKPEVVLSFLQLKDLGLIVLMAVAVIIAIPIYKIISKRYKKPVCGESFYKFPKETNTRSTVVGAIIFGLGWGLSGLCPGSALASIGVGNFPILIGIAGMFLGAYVQGRFLEKI